MLRSVQRRWEWPAHAAVSAVQALPQTLKHPDQAPLQQRRLGQAAVALSAAVVSGQTLLLTLALTHPVRVPLPQMRLGQAAAGYSAAAARLKALAGLP